MTGVRGHWQHGIVVLDEPVRWPEGCPLVIAEADRELTGMTEAEQSDDPHSIERWIAEMKAIPPLVLSPDEEVQLLATLNWAGEFNVDAVRQQMRQVTP